jgi:transglutaminase-like putative cysteine protease
MNYKPPPSTLAPGKFVDSDHPAVRTLANRATGNSKRERAVSLYHFVRDGIRYDPYRIDLSRTGMRASTAAVQGYGWCVTKAALLAACARAIGIPARLGFADVRNHLSTQRMREMLQTDLFIWHGYAEVWLGGRWLKATPAFNIELCERFRLAQLEWDGDSDSIYHPYDLEGRRHMEYVRERGTFDDVPVTDIAADIASTYPAWRPVTDEGEFERDTFREAP